ncbi:SLC13 family permease [Chloroflexota bacterium]
MNTKRNIVIYLSLLVVVLVLSLISTLTTPQSISLVLFSSMIFGTLFFWRFRLAFALLSIAALLIFGLLDLHNLIAFAGLDIILFLIGMMVLVGLLEERHFFGRLVAFLVGRIGGKAWKLVVALMLLSALFAALVDEVTSILFMIAITFRITERFKINPVPFLIMVVFATNIGSSATVVGNPVGVMIALRGGLTFVDFLRWATPIAAVSLLIVVLLSLKLFTPAISRLQVAMDKESKSDLEGKLIQEKSPFSSDMLICWGLFLGTLVSLVMHSQLEQLLGLGKNSLLVGTSMVAAGVSLLVHRHGARDIVERRVDWWSLSFFMLLFSSVGTLQFVGTTEVIAQGFISLVGGNESLLFFSLAGLTALLSAVLDNVLAVATLIPIIQDLGSAGFTILPLWWIMLFAGTLGGNLTMIGSTANIVALGYMERKYHGQPDHIHIGFGQWLRVGIPVTLATLPLAALLLYVQLLL